MSNEIKEILNYMKEISSFEHTTDWFELNCEDTKILFNYITNLQDRIDKTIMTINEFRQINYETIKRLSNKTGISDMLKNDNTIYNLIENILRGESKND